MRSFNGCVSRLYGKFSAFTQVFLQIAHIVCPAVASHKWEILSQEKFQKFHKVTIRLL